MAISTEYAEGYARGINAGWDDANYADAYGTKVDAERAFAARIGDKAWAREHAEFHSGFMTGYPEGVDRFKNDQFADGESITA